MSTTETWLVAAGTWTGLSAAYRDFIRSHQRLFRNPARLTGAKALVARTELIWAHRHFPFRDSRLPVELRPEPWPGVRAYELFRTVHAALGPAARAFVGGVVGRELPDPDRATA